MKQAYILMLLIIAFNSISTISFAQIKKTSKCTSTIGYNTNVTLTAEETLISKPYLDKLNSFQNNCNSKAYGSIMFFSSIPTEPSANIAEANRLSYFLTAMSKIGIRPIIVSEPVNFNFLRFNAGEYDNVVNSFFVNLKSTGVTDSMMGMWVPFPEPNIPAWDSVGSTPTIIATNFNRYMSILQSQFPTIKGSLLLNSRTYAPEDKNYTNGQYTSFTEYGVSLNSQYLDSVGIQGFPWYSPRNKQWGNTIDANVFLQPKLAIEYAKAARTNKIWFNTGSASSVYTNDSLKTVTISSSNRANILNSILTVANQAKLGLGLNSRVMINLFSQDKSSTPEAINWSYTSLADLDVLKNFITRAIRQNIDLSFFDV
jgi:hypothetical protein